MRIQKPEIKYKAINVALAITLFWWLSAGSIQADAQSPLGAGIAPFSTLTGSQYDIINLANGRITFNLPIRTKPGPYSTAFTLMGAFAPYYQQTGENPNGTGYAIWNKGSGLGTVVNGHFALASETWTTTTYTCTAGASQGTYQQESSVLITDATGVPYTLVDSSGHSPSFYTQPGCTNGASSPAAGSVFTAGPFTLVTSTAGYPGGTIYDVSGNALGTSGVPHVGTAISPNGVTLYSDTSTQTSPSSGLSNVEDTFNDAYDTQILQAIYSYNEQVVFAASQTTTTFTYTDSSGKNQTATLTFTPMTFQTNYQCGSNGVNTDQAATPISLPTSLSLPNGRAFTFTYETTPGFAPNTTGRIQSIGLPDGGSITYAYTGGNNGSFCGTIIPAGAYVAAVSPIITRTVSDANSHQSVWTYTFSEPTNPTTSGQTTTTVVDPAQNTTVYHFINGYQTEALSYQGSASGPLLKHVITCRNGNFSNCTTTGTVLPPLQTDTYTSYDNGPYSLEENIYNGKLLPVESKKYDFGAAMPPVGTPLSDTVTTYGTWNGSTCVSIANYIQDKPCEITVKGNGTILSDVRNTYDGKGNLTQTSSLVSGSTYVSQTFAYDPNGAVNKVTDGRGNSTTISNTACNNLLPTSMTKAGLTSSETWDCNGGVVESATGFNPGETTTYQYNDPLYRLTSVQLPDGGTTSMCYSDVGGSGCTKSSTANVVYSATTASPDPTIKSTVTSDGLGREISRSVTTDPQGADSVDTTYDSVGRVQSVSNPHRTYASPETDGITSYTYDALSRVLMQCNQDNGTTQTCTAGSSYRHWVYTQATTDIYDEQQDHTQQTVDGLGRLVSVTEPNDTNTLTFVTGYTYDALSNLTRVDQWGGAVGTSGERARTFTYDGLSRLVCASNPETSTASCPLSASTATPAGVTAYSYDANGNLITRKDALGTITNYAYDALDRITSKTYPTLGPNVAPTSSVNYGYDVAIAGWGWTPQTSPSYPNVSQTNLLGRLSSVSVGSVGANAWTVYGYDAAGRIVLKSECLPIDCGNNHHDMHYKYDLAGNQTFYDRGLDVAVNSRSPNAGFYFGGYTQTYDGAGNLASVTGDTAGANRATNILSTTDYFPTGLLYTSLDLGVYSMKHSASPRNWYTGQLLTDPASTTLWQSTATHDNRGKISATGDTGAGHWTFTHGPLLRLWTAVGPAGSITYADDPFGNKQTQTVTAGVAPPQSNSVAVSNALTGNGLTYDLMDSSGVPKGNITYDGFHHYTYDAEGRLYSVDGTTCYTYDGDGDRVAKTNCNVVNAGNGTTSGILTEFLYDTNHRLMSEVNVSTAQIARANIYAGGQLIAEDAPDSFVTTSTATLLRVTDQVGTLRGLYDLGEHLLESCTSFPYGDGVTCSSSADNELFTGKRSDAESGLDYSGARYYNSTLGRFISPDPSGLTFADIGDPQTLNLYAYVRSNPLADTDFFGLRINCSPVADTVGTITQGDESYSFVSTNPPDCEDDGQDQVTTKIPYRPPVPPPRVDLPQLGCKTGFGVGGVVGVEGGIGAGPGAVATGSAGGAILFNGFHLPNLAGFLTSALAAGKSGSPAQTSGPVTAVGGGGSAGGGLFLTNATNASQLKGSALTFSGSVDVGVGLGVSLSIGTDASGNTIYTGTVTAGYGLKFYGYSATTNTKAKGTGPTC